MEDLLKIAQHPEAIWNHEAPLETLIPCSAQGAAGSSRDEDLRSGALEPLLIDLWLLYPER